MSHFSEVRVEITDEGCLLAALGRLGFAGKVEVHKEAHPLYGYQGDVREQKAHGLTGSGFRSSIRAITNMMIRGLVVSSNLTVLRRCGKRPRKKDSD
jgi:hypothetical protein